MHSINTIFPALRAAASPDLATWMDRIAPNIQNLIEQESESVADMVLKHDPEEGTTLRFRRNDVWGAFLKKMHPRFIWSKSRVAWYIQHSTDKKVPPWPLRGIAEQIEQGLKILVAVHQVKKPTRSVADQEAARKERASGRQERFTRYSFSAQKRSEQHYEASHGAIAGIPMGQPILVGHHSERKHRKAVQRAQSHMSKSVEESNKAAHWQSRIEGSESHQSHREDPNVALRRIQGLEADLRKVQRHLEGEVQWGGDGRIQIVKPAGEWLEHQEARKEELVEQIAYWKEQIGMSGKRAYGPNDFRVGEVLGGLVVMKVGDKSVTLASTSGQYGFSGHSAYPLSYVDMGTTARAPREAAPEPEAKGKHPRSAQIDAIYAAHTPNAWKVRIGWKHGIVVLNPSQKGHVMFVVLEDIPDAALDALAIEHNVPLTGKIKEVKHPHAKLIKAIYGALGSGNRKQEAGKHIWIRHRGGTLSYITLENLPENELVKLAFEEGVDLRPFDVSTGWNRVETLEQIVKIWSGLIDGVKIQSNQADRLLTIIKEVPSARAWIDQQPIQKLLFMADHWYDHDLNVELRGVESSSGRFQAVLRKLQALEEKTAPTDNDPKGSDDFEAIKAFGLKTGWSVREKKTIGGVPFTGHDASSIWDLYCQLKPETRVKMRAMDAAQLKNALLKLGQMRSNPKKHQSKAR